MNLLERIFGANWRTTLSGAGFAFTGLLTALAAAPAELGDVSTIFPPEWKPRIFAVGAFAAFLLKLINASNSKDKQVIGNGTSFAPNRVPGENGGNRTLAPIILALLLPAFLLTGCTIGADGHRHLDSAKIDAWWNSPTTRSVVTHLEEAAFNAALVATGQAISGQPVNWQQDALYGLSASVRSVENTPAASPSGVANVVLNGSVVGDAFAQPLAAVFATGISQGVPSAVAAEATARGVANAAAFLTNP